MIGLACPSCGGAVVPDIECDAGVVAQPRLPAGTGTSACVRHAWLGSGFGSWQRPPVGSGMQRRLFVGRPKAPRGCMRCQTAHYDLDMRACQDGLLERRCQKPIAAAIMQKTIERLKCVALPSDDSPALPDTAENRLVVIDKLTACLKACARAVACALVCESSICRQHQHTQ